MSVHRHYVEQLEGTEWMQQRQYVADTSTTSRWSLTTEEGAPWKAKLTIARDEEAQDSYHLEFVARRALQSDHHRE